MIEILQGFKSIEELLDHQWQMERAVEYHNWKIGFDFRCGLIAAEVANEIQDMFREAFPNRWYVFLVQRPRDLDGGIPPWPMMLRDEMRALVYEHRVTPVQEVRF